MKFIVALIIGIPFAWHVCATALYLGPVNLLEIELQNAVKTYMHPLFYQNWHLFSPNPGISSDIMQLRCKRADEKDWRKWVDPTEGIRHRFNQNRMSGRGKVLYIYRQLPKGVFDSYRKQQKTCMSQETKKRKEAGEKIDTQALSRNECGYDNVLPLVREQREYRLARRFALDVCEATYGDGVNDIQTQIRVGRVMPKPFTERHTKERWGRVVNLQFPTETRIAGEKENAKGTSETTVEEGGVVASEEV